MCVGIGDDDHIVIAQHNLVVVVFKVNGFKRSELDGFRQMHGFKSDGAHA